MRRLFGNKQKQAPSGKRFEITRAYKDSRPHLYFAWVTDHLHNDSDFFSFQQADAPTPEEIIAKAETEFNRKYQLKVDSKAFSDNVVGATA